MSAAGPGKGLRLKVKITKAKDPALEGEQETPATSALDTQPAGAPQDVGLPAAPAAAAAEAPVQPAGPAAAAAAETMDTLRMFGRRKPARPAVVPTPAPGALSEAKKAILAKLKPIFQALQKRTKMENLKRNEVEPNGRRVFDLTALRVIPAEELRILDDEFQTLRFTPEGFSGLEGPGLDTDFAKFQELLQQASVSAPVAAALAAPAVATPIVAKAAKAILPEEAAVDAATATRRRDPVATSVATAAAAAIDLPPVPGAAMPKPPLEEEDVAKFGSTKLARLAQDIRGIETASPYGPKTPNEDYVPQTRRAFANFILNTYSDYSLPPPSAPDWDACKTLGSEGVQIKAYQAFVRDYMSYASPYRGLLVYHGLGSGKTCTAIAAAEALYATSRRRIIVMTPFSLRKNFINEITFCGFRHFRLQNHWLRFSNDPIKHPTLLLFAKEIMGIPESYLKTARHVWIPDFTKPPNFDELSRPEYRTEIRNQITATLVYDPDPSKNLNGRIWFINYNGISAKKLKELACLDPPTAFDNAVIIVDEVHNLVRMMQGIIEPYMTQLKGVAKKIKFEPITPYPWRPDLCGKSMNYKRGWLMYRLLTGAQNSKLIGLSGTPLINFPEELGILMNVLHGYIHCVRGVVAASPEGEAKLRTLLSDEYPYADFQEVKKTDRGLQFMISLLPQGIRHPAGSVGVERVPPTEAPKTYADCIKDLETQLTSSGFTLVGKLQVESLPLLPAIGEEFRDTFVSPSDGVTLQNTNVLAKRLSGMISYYKGSRKDLMPQVARDEILRVPFSKYQQDAYSRVRLAEIAKEEETAPSGGQASFAKGRAGAVWSEVYEIKNARQAANYRMGSRQACNFVFPETISRPRPANEKEAEGEVGKDALDIIDPPSHDADDPEDSLSERLNAEDAAESDAEEEEPELERDEEADYIEAQRQELEEAGNTPEEIERALVVLVKAYRARKALTDFKPLPGTGRKGKEETLVASKATEAQRCQVYRFKGESYQEAKNRAKECLFTVGKPNMQIAYVTQANGRQVVDTTKGLYQLSPKFVSMIENINRIALRTNEAGELQGGSSLVYSQFLEMEGIGIFTMALQANGYDPIVLESSGKKDVRFSAATIASLRKGPAANQPRFITFTGGEPEEIRRYAIDIFNARFASLPPALATVLGEAGYTNNQHGEICRVFCITSAGAEGLSLKNVRGVHIMEPYWNEVRMAQVKGRAIRICSHMDIDPPTERSVEIYTYVTVFGVEAQMGKDPQWKISPEIVAHDSLSITTEQAAKFGIVLAKGAQNYILSSDERLFLISQRKKTIIDNLQAIMKASAVDCRMNFAENNDGTFQCQVITGKVGEYLYHPDLATDIQQTGIAFGTEVVLPKGLARAESADEGAAALEEPTIAMEKMLRLRIKRAGVSQPFYLRKGPTAFFEGVSGGSGRQLPIVWLLYEGEYKVGEAKKAVGEAPIVVQPDGSETHGPIQFYTP